MAELIDGNKIAAEIIAGLTNEVRNLPGTPCVAFIRVGEDPASVSYVRKKDQTAAAIGIESRLHVFPESVTQEELFSFIDQLNADENVHGILVQAPLPPHIDETLAFRRIDATKDVDGFHTLNLGKLCQEDPTGFVACTPQGVMELLERSHLPLDGKHVVILGRSLIVGKPFALLAMQKKPFANATVTVCHSRTKNLPDLVRQADVVVAAMGKPEFVTADMIKPGAVVIDVGINRVPDASRKSGYRLTGDVDFPAVSEKASHITPVPGGVGPMTVALLMKNTVKAYRQQTL